MISKLGRHGLLSICACATLAGCKGRERGNATYVDTLTSGGAIAPSTDSAKRAAAAESTANATRSAWTDPQILGFADAASRAEVTEASLAERRATSSQVRSFAHDLVKEHKAMLQEARTFGAKNDITPDTVHAAVTERMTEARDQLKELEQMKSGKAWDRQFVQNQLEDHKKVLEVLQDAEKSTTNEDLKHLLLKASGHMQSTIARAQRLLDTTLHG